MVPAGFGALLEMLDPYAREFIICVEMIGEIKTRVLGFKQFQNMDQEEAHAIVRSLAILRSHCVGLELTMAVAQIDRMHSALAGRNVPFLEFGQMLTALRERIDDQLAARVFLAIDSRNLGFFSSDPKANNRRRSRAPKRYSDLASSGVSHQRQMTWRMPLSADVVIVVRPRYFI